jgi:hypothetical protein
MALDTQALMSKPPSPHATARRYWSGCRCADCLRAHNEYCRANHQTKRGNPIVPADAARDHLRALQAAGVHVDAVSALLGMNRRDVMQIRAGRWPRIRQKRERAILDLDSSAVSSNGFVPAAKTRARMAAISKAGLSQKEIGRRLGLRSKPRIARAAVVRATKAEQVRQLYAEIVLWPKRKPRRMTLDKPNRSE